MFHDFKEVHGDGIEAWITMKQENMVEFETDKKLISHVS